MQQQDKGARWSWTDTWAFDLLLSLLALAGLAISAYWGFSLSKEQFAASDLKTLYASVWCFAHGQNAYAIPNLQAVFAANHVVQPPTWYGHAPVYPPTTLLLLTPLASLPMVPALYVALAVFVLLLALALTALLRYASSRFGLRLIWKAVMVALFAAGPLLGFALTMGNLSLAAAALVILAFVLRAKESSWPSAAMLALSFLLKPHIALWLAVCMLFLPEKRSPGLVIRAAILTALALLSTAGYMSVAGTLSTQVHGYRAILQSEMAGSASMSPASHEPLPVITQITSLQSFLGFWAGDGAATKLAANVVLLAIAALLIWYTRRQRHEEGALLAAGAWLAFGMLATYHRAADAIVLLLLLPWVLLRISRAPRDWWAWSVSVLYCLMSVGPDLETVTRLAQRLPSHSAEAFFLLRQAGIASLFLLALLLVVLRRATTRTQSCKGAL